MYLIVYGPEGSGKGTQAELLSEKLKIPVYTSGDLVRESANKDKGLIGNICRNALSRGIYVPDNQMFVLWGSKLESKDAKKGFILDGFPRNFNQSNFLFEKLDRNAIKINKVIYLHLTDKEAKVRLIKRCRKLFEGSNLSHDTPERINQRLETYRKLEKELLEFFHRRKILLEINGSDTVEDINKNIIKNLNLNE